MAEGWDKTFSQSEQVQIKRVNFKNRYGIALVGDLYLPKNFEGKLEAVAVCDPFGAVKEQSSGSYAQTIAENVFAALAFDLSYTGEGD